MATRPRKIIAANEFDNKKLLMTKRKIEESFDELATMTFDIKNYLNYLTEKYCDSNDEKENQQTELTDSENQKDGQTLMIVLKRMKKRGNNNKKLLWEFMYDEYNNDEIDEKERRDNENNNNEKNEQCRISQLTDVRYTQMCKYGHGTWYDNSYFMKCTQKCIQCGSMEGRKYCNDCCWYDGGNGYNSRIVSRHVYCEECRKINAVHIKNRIKMDEFKAKIIREELLKNPSLEMDLLCNMPRKAALETLIIDINRLQFGHRREWCVLAMDMDHLKAWNTCIGHTITDKLIKKIADIMSTYVNDVNKGKWINKNDRYASFYQAFIFRTGGDEFVMVLKCESAMFCKLGLFYNKMKNEINKLGSNIKALIPNENEWNKATKKLNAAKDRNGKPLNMKIVGISTGIYVPHQCNDKKEDWLLNADKVALEKAKTINLPNKNSVAIYYEYIFGLVPNEKVLACLEKGVGTIFPQI
eukprot:450518_1